MKISQFSITRPLATMMIIVALIFIGIVSLRGLPIDLFPEIDFPLVTVQVPYPGAAPGDVEKGITTKIEDALASLTDVKKLTSYSREGTSFVVVEFDWGIDLDTKAIDVREKVDRVKSTFPDGADDPIVFKFDMMSSEGVLQFAVTRKLTSGERDRHDADPQFRNDVAYQTRKFVEDEVTPEIERISGVALASVSGGREREVLVSVDMYKLKAKGVTLTDVENALDWANVEQPGGRLDEARTEISTRFLGKFTSVDQMNGIEVKRVNGKPVYLRDIATVEDTYKEARSYARFNGTDAILVDVNKESGANSAAIADAIYPRLDALRTRFPGYDFAVSLDFTDFLRESIQMVKSNATMGAVIAMLILLLFLRDLRSVIIAGIAIPTAVIATFTLIKTADLTLNLLSLGGLALGIGMLVDNSVVMLENITRRIGITRSPEQGAREGATEIGSAISASTYTTMAVFVPVLFFVTGVPSQIFDDLALTVAFALACSLIVALTFVPMACSKLLRPRTGKVIDLIANPEGVAENPFMRRLQAVVDHVLHWRTVAVVVVLGLLLLAGVVLATRGLVFFPEFDRGEFTVNVQMPVDASLEATERAAREIEQIIRDNVPSLEHYSTTVNPQSASFDVTMTKDRAVSTFEVRQALRRLVNVIPGATVMVGEVGHRGGGGSADVEILVRGPTNVAEASLRGVADRVAVLAQPVEGAVNVESQLKAGRREVHLDPDHMAISTLGLTNDFIAKTLNTYQTGKVVTSYREQDDEYDVRLKLANAQSLTLDELNDLLIPLPAANTTTTIDQVADVSEGRGAVELQRQDRERVARVTADVAEGAVLSEVTKGITDVVEREGLPEGYSFQIGGEEEDRQEAMGQLQFALIISIAIVYMILVAQFESLVDPLIIIQTIPLCFVGVALALLVTGLPISLMVMLGIIMLAGIVVNNAIVLVDFINTLRHRGHERREAVVLATQVRLRPIVMTTLTTMGGMAPLALGLGSGSELYQAMAITVIGGLFISTFFTVIYIPATYIILDDLSVWTKKRLAALEQTVESAINSALGRLFGRSRKTAEGPSVDEDPPTEG
ncbi:MAG: efflux RND transporter permease subunit [Verrucomicrobia bacterium]|nr:efflux RND transporter permease subunit [Verrucomicrobiota bacterium]